jgi:DNA repair protein RadD
MDISQILSRADEGVIQQILGKSVVRILHTLDSNHSRLAVLKKIMLDLYSGSVLLSKKQSRDEIIDLLYVDEVKNLANLLGLVKPQNDFYEQVKALPFSKKQLDILFSFFEITITEEEKIEIPAKSAVSPTQKLFEHQRKAIVKIKKLLYESNKRVLLHMPTGSGKTKTAIHTICNHFINHEPTVVVWLAHSEELCEQAYSEFIKVWTNLGNRDLPIFRLWGGSKIDLQEIKNGFVVAGLKTLFNRLLESAFDISTLANRCSLVVIDEAHQAIAPTYKSLLDILISFNASLLGLSATPGRTWNDPQKDKELADFFSRQKVSLVVDGYNNPVDYLIENGYLARVKHSPLFFQSGFTLTKEELDYLGKYLDIPEKALQRLSNDEQRNIRVVQEAETLAKSHKRIILFAVSVENSNMLATILQARGVKAYSVTGSTPSNERKRFIEIYKSDIDEPIILCNYGVLTTGFDAPKTSGAIIARPTLSLVLYSQMVGRAIRGEKAGGNAEAEIVTVVDSTLQGFDSVANAFFNWEDVW